MVCLWPRRIPIHWNQLFDISTRLSLSLSFFDCLLIIVRWLPALSFIVWRNSVVFLWVSVMKCPGARSLTLIHITRQHRLININNFSSILLRAINQWSGSTWICVFLVISCLVPALGKCLFNPLFFLIVTVDHSRISLSLNESHITITYPSIMLVRSCKCAVAVLILLTHGEHWLCSQIVMSRIQGT